MVQPVYVINVFENVTKGSEIFQLKAQDVDTNEKLSYSIYTSLSPITSNILLIEPWSGILRLTADHLDRESMDKHVLTLEVADSRFTKLGHRNSGFKSSSADGAGDKNSNNNNNNNNNEDMNEISGKMAPPAPTLMPFAASSHRAFTQIIINVLDVNDHPVSVIIILVGVHLLFIDFLMFLKFFCFNTFLSSSSSVFLLITNRRFPSLHVVYILVLSTFSMFPLSRLFVIFILISITL